MIRCKTCLYPSTKPDLHFDEYGECSACRAFKNRPNIDWDERKEQLIKLLDRFDGKCIVPSSGGKDSTYQAITLKNLGADVTVVTARTCHLTDIGRMNIDNLSKHCRTVEYIPNMSVRAKLNRLGLEIVGDISWPEHAVIFSTPFRAARDLNIPLIMYGECPQAEYGGPMGSEQSMQMTKRWITEFGGFLGLRPSDFVGVEGITSTDMTDYSLIWTQNSQVEAHFLGQYIPWDSHENAKVAIANGMSYELPSAANWWPWENLDNAQTGVHDYFGYLKYGYGRGAAQISVDVRNGLITREDALNWVKSFDGFYPFIYAGVPLEETLDKIGMTVDKFLDICNQFTNWELFENTDSFPVLKEC